MVENEASLPRCLGLGMKASIVSHIASGSGEVQQEWKRGCESRNTGLVPRPSDFFFQAIRSAK